MNKEHRKRAAVHDLISDAVVRLGDELRTSRGLGGASTSLGRVTLQLKFAHMRGSLCRP